MTKAKLVDPADGIGYLQLTGFQKTSTDEIDQAIAALSRQGMKVLVLDLRGNPGGLLNVAVEIAERFIDSGLIVSTRGRAQGQTQALIGQRPGSSGGCRSTSWSITTAPAPARSSPAPCKTTSGRTILGARTYGKGSVQSIFSLRSAPAGLKLTTAKFYSPLNRPYSEQGSSPTSPSLAPPPPSRPTTPRRPRGIESPATRTSTRPRRRDPDRQEPLSLSLRSESKRTGSHGRSRQT